MNIFRSVTPGVPLSRRRVTELADFLFPPLQPTFLTTMITVAIPEASAESITQYKGSLQSLSPEELVHAMLYACARDIKALHDQENGNLAGAGDPLPPEAAKAVLPQWHEVLLSVPCAFKVVAGDTQRFFVAYNLRQQLLQEHECMQRSALQLCHEIMLLKEKLEADMGVRPPAACARGPLPDELAPRLPPYHSMDPM